MSKQKITFNTEKAKLKKGFFFGSDKKLHQKSYFYIQLFLVQFNLYTLSYF